MIEARNKASERREFLMIALAEEAEKKNLKVGVGLMLRHCRARRALWERIRSGEIGEIVCMRSTTLLGPNNWRLGIKFLSPAGTVQKKPNNSELLFQIERFLSFLWAGGGTYSDYYIHQIDACCWMKDAWPEKAHALGGLHYRHPAVDQNLDTYSVEYTYPDGTRLFYYGRNMAGCHREWNSFAYGTKGSAVISAAGHDSRGIRTYKGQDMKKADLTWQAPQHIPSCYQLEFDELIDAIRRDKPYNEARRGAEASLVAAMGRMAAHTGQVITYDQILNHEHEFAPDLDKLTVDSPAPVQPNPNGQYPVPMPGIRTKREY
jgi:predicted dehydrogenase